MLPVASWSQRSWDKFLPPANNNLSLLIKQKSYNYFGAESVDIAELWNHKKSTHITSKAMLSQVEYVGRVGILTLPRMQYTKACSPHHKSCSVGSNRSNFGLIFFLKTTPIVIGWVILGAHSALPSLKRILVTLPPPSLVRNFRSWFQLLPFLPLPPPSLLAWGFHWLWIKARKKRQTYLFFSAFYDSFSELFFSFSEKWFLSTFPFFFRHASPPSDSRYCFSKVSFFLVRIFIFSISPALHRFMMRPFLTFYSSFLSSQIVLERSFFSLSLSLALPYLRDRPVRRVHHHRHYRRHRRRRRHRSRRYRRLLLRRMLVRTTAAAAAATAAVAAAAVAAPVSLRGHHAGLRHDDVGASSASAATAAATATRQRAGRHLCGRKKTERDVKWNCQMEIPPSYSGIILSLSRSIDFLSFLLLLLLLCLLPFS